MTDIRRILCFVSVECRCSCFVGLLRKWDPPCARQEVGSGSFDVVARHLAIGVEGGALTAELDGRQFAAALESYMHADEEVRLMRLSAFLAIHALRI